jgi:hypothetical protein
MHARETLCAGMVRAQAHVQDKGCAGLPGVLGAGLQDPLHGALCSTHGVHAEAAASLLEASLCVVSVSALC